MTEENGNSSSDAPSAVGEQNDKTSAVEDGEEAKDAEESAAKGGEDGDDEEKKPKSEPKDWPMRDIKEPGDNDVLFGRGGEYSVAP